MHLASSPRVAFITESHCIGCTLCVPACPTGAIVGAAKFRHGVVEALCIGCGKCLPPCPVQCINMNEIAPAQAPLQARQPNGRFTPQAIQGLQRAVERISHHRRQKNMRTFKQISTAKPSAIPELSHDILAAATKARAASEQRYQAKGPLKTPKVLREKTKATQKVDASPKKP